MTTTIPYGCSFAASAFSGYFTSMAMPYEAKKFSYLTIVLAVISLTLATGGMAIFQEELIQFFYLDAKTRQITETVLPILYVYSLFSGSMAWVWRRSRLAGGNHF
jgi:Na+-driven multidrug efflux pump